MGNLMISGIQGRNSWKRLVMMSARSADLYEVSMCFFTQFHSSLVGNKSGR